MVWIFVSNGSDLTEISKEPVTKIVTQLCRSGQFPALARLQG